MLTMTIGTLTYSRIPFGNGGRYGRLSCVRCGKCCTARRMFAVLVGGVAAIVCKRCRNRLAAKHSHTQGA